MIRLSALLAAGLLCTGLASAQDSLSTPRTSPLARVSQTVGLTEMTVEYSRPAARGRVIYGGLLPYGAIWRVGANENTTITFEHPVVIAGETLPEGVYGIHMIPDISKWTVMFSKDSTAWGSGRYDQAKDAARVFLKTESTPYTERLTFSFDEVDQGSTVLSMRWAELCLPIRIETATHERVLDPVREAFANDDQNAGWQYWFQAADYGVLHDVDAAELLAWTDRSIDIYRNFTNLWMKSDLLIELGKADQADSVRGEALELVTVDELDNLGRRYMRHENYASAAAVFGMVTQANPDGWWGFDMLAGALVAAGDDAGAAKAWKQALAKGPDDASKARITASLESLAAPAG